MDRTAAVDQPSKCRSSTTNQPLRGRANGNTAQGRRARDLYLGFLKTMPDPGDVIAQARCLDAAELVVAYEQVRLQHFRGEADDERLKAFANLADRAVRSLGIGVTRAHHVRKKGSGVDALDHYLGGSEVAP